MPSRSASTSSGTPLSASATRTSRWCSVRQPSIESVIASHQLTRFGLTLGTLAGIGHQRPDLRLEHDLALLPGPSAQTHAGLEQAELVRPGREAARAAIVVELASTATSASSAACRARSSSSSPRTWDSAVAAAGRARSAWRAAAAGATGRRPRRAPTDEAQGAQPSLRVGLRALRFADRGADGKARAHARAEANSRRGAQHSAPLMVERRQDPRRERRRAASLDQPDQRMQIHAALARELLGQRSAEAGLAQPCAAPGDRVRWLSVASRLAFASRLSALSGLSAGPRSTPT